MPKKDESQVIDMSLSLNDKDEELNKKINLMIEEGQSLIDSKKKHWEDNDKFFNGKQWSGERQEYQSDTVINRIFPGIRNMVWLATDSRPKADILPAPALDDKQADVNKSKAKKLGLLFDQRWDELQMNMKGTVTLFQAFIYDDAFWMPFWNYYDNDFDLEIIKGKDIVIDPTANNVDEAGYIIFRPMKNRKWIQYNFPEQYNSVIFGDSKESTTSEPGKKTGYKDQVRIDDTWTDDIRVIRAGKTILWKGPQPYYEFREEEEQAADWEKSGNTMDTFRAVQNYFRRPKKPLIIIPTYNVGELFSRSLMDQLKPVQRTIDKRKQQIDENANQMANSQWIYDINALTEEDAAKLTNEPGLQVGIDGIDNIKKEGGAEMPSFVLNDLSHSESTFDNIMGHHDISRGAQDKTQSATEAGILREADQTPVRLLVRNYENSILELYQWWMQLASLFYTEDHYVRVWGEQETIDYASVNRFDISDGINIVIRPGSTLPTDKKTLRSDAIQLTQVGFMDPLTLFEIMELPDPHKTANRLVNWQKGIISDEPQSAPQGAAQAGQQETADVQWAKAEEARIARGENPQINPQMVTENMLGEHQMALESGQFPEPDLLKQHMQAEVQILQQGGKTEPQPQA